PALTRPPRARIALLGGERSSAAPIRHRSSTAPVRNLLRMGLRKGASRADPYLWASLLRLPRPNEGATASPLLPSSVSMARSQRAAQLRLQTRAPLLLVEAPL